MEKTGGNVSGRDVDLEPSATAGVIQDLAGGLAGLVS